MSLYEIDGVAPHLDEGAWAAPSSDLIGDVRLEARASVWFGAVLRGDFNRIVVGAAKPIVAASAIASSGSLSTSWTSGSKP